MNNILNKYVGQIKHLIKDISDRVISSSMYTIIRAERFPLVLRDAVKWTVYKVDDFVWLLYDFPRIKAFRLRGEEWCVVFVGVDGEYRVIMDIIFQDQEVQVEQLSKVLAWRLPAQTSSWLESGVDLVVCELSHLFPWKFTAPYSFSGPDLVIQALHLPENLEDLLVGRRIEGNRRWIRKAEKQGFDFTKKGLKGFLELSFHSITGGSEFFPSGNVFALYR